MSRLREALSLVLLALLPLHALLITVATTIIAGADHAPLGALAVWKEAVLMLIVALAVIELVRTRLETRNSKLDIDILDALILGLILLSVIVTFFTHKNWSLYAYGFKYDFLAMGSVLVLRRVEWSQAFLQRANTVVLTVGALVAGYGLLTLVLPQTFFTWLGYSDLHSVYRPGHPLPAYHQIGGTALRRIQSTLSGPNQLGLWLLLPWALALLQSIRNQKLVTRYSLLALLFGLGILFSFSRAAWISAFVIGLSVLHLSVSKSLFRTVTLGVASVAIVSLIVGVLVVPQLILRVASSKDHLLRPLQALHTMVEHPLGMGLGTAGPASNRVSDTCMSFAEGEDSSWTQERPELCVFVGETQVQPTDRVCNCPLLPENWYLQIGVELGFLGFFAFLALVFTMLNAFRFTETAVVTQAAQLAFVGICIASLFLHAWEESAVAYSVWLLLAPALLPKQQRSIRNS